LKTAADAKLQLEAEAKAAEEKAQWKKDEAQAAKDAANTANQAAIINTNLSTTEKAAVLAVYTASVTTLETVTTTQTQASAAYVIQ